MTETREQVVARVTAAVEGAADGAFDFDRPNPVTGAPLGLVAPRPRRRPADHRPGRTGGEARLVRRPPRELAGRAGRFDRTVRPLDCLQRCRIVKQET